MSDIFERFEKEIAENKIVLYMKGTADFPQCGFSATVVQILRKHNAPFLDVNVLADEEVREGIKEFSDWPTIPQLYVNGEFIGGCDIVKELEANGEFADLLKN